MQDNEPAFEDYEDYPDDLFERHPKSDHPVYKSNKKSHPKKADGLELTATEFDKLMMKKRDEMMKEIFGYPKKGV